MKRREFVAGLGLTAAWSSPTFSQRNTRIPRIGVLLPGTPDGDYGDDLPAFVRGMEDLGYGEGRDFVLELRWADGRMERLPALAAELVDRKVDVVLVASALAANAALKATPTIPIVQATGGSPVGTGAAGSLGRPQGNLTGFTNQSEDVSGKLLELLLMVVPEATRVGVLMVPGAPVTEPQMKQVQEAAKSLRVAIHPIGLSQPAALKSAFAELGREQVSGLVVFSAALIVSLSREVVEAALSRRLPAIYPFRNFALHGGLMAYGTDRRRQFHGAARFVDRILKGTKPGDLPVEQPTKFELVINLKTASALGLTMPPMLLARADEVIE